MDIKSVLEESKRIVFYGRYSTDKQDIEMQRHSVKRLDHMAAQY